MDKYLILAQNRVENLRWRATLNIYAQFRAAWGLSVRGISDVTTFLNSERLSASHLQTGYWSDGMCTYRFAPRRQIQAAIAARIKKIPPPIDDPSIMASLLILMNGRRNVKMTDGNVGVR